MRVRAGSPRGGRAGARLARRVVTGAARTGGLGLLALARSLSPTGIAVGASAYAVSTQPSLIPRRWQFQGAVSGLALLAGYALGSPIERVATQRWSLPERLGPVVRPVAGAALLGVALASLATGARGQRRITDLWGVPPRPAHTARVLPMSLGVFLAPLLLARGLSGAARRLAPVLERVLPRPLARAGAGLLVVAAAAATVRGVVVNGLRFGVQGSFIRLNASAEAGVDRPVSPERSGSPASDQTWEGLGYYGRRFVATGPSASEIEDLSGRPALTPIRVYAGVSSQTDDLRLVDLDALAAAAVAELDRTDAWRRRVLAVVTTTGTGWVDGDAVAALEHLHHGDTAVVAMQYSVDPSWVQLLLDVEQPARAGRALFEAVHARWATLPADARPLLVPFGLSLGSYGSQAAFADVDDVLGRTDGAIWAGTPRFAPLLHSLTERRDPGSREIHPVLDGGRHVRWGTGNGGEQHLDALGGADGPRIVYLQHASDGVARWWWPAAWRRDDWFREERGPDVVPGIRWWPLLTGVQLMFDLFASGDADVPVGFGHNYGESYVDAWHWVTRPEGWDPESLARLRTVIHDLRR